MGIRFLCGHCQGPLNVKERLAGEYCFCPDCNEEILVPLRSTIERSEKRSRRKELRKGHRDDFDSADSGSGTATLNCPDRISGISDAYAAGVGSNRIVAEVTASLRAVEASQKAAEEEARLAAEAEARRIAEEESRLAAEVEAKRLAEEAAFLTAETVERKRPENDFAAKVFDSDIDALGYIESEFDDAGDTELETGSENQAAQNNSSAKDTETSSSRSFLLSKPVAKIEDDPLQSNPKLIWYLRHRSFGEKGPLKAHQLETLLETGQLRAGAILWREDWNDWLPVEQVFPQTVQEKPKTNYEIPDELNPHSETNRKLRAQKRFWMGFNTVAFLLIIVLVYWLAQVIS